MNFSYTFGCALEKAIIAGNNSFASKRSLYFFLQTLINLSGNFSINVGEYLYKSS